MQGDVSLILSISAALFSVMISVYLLVLWLSYENRLLTDLPLLFGVSFAFQGANTLIQALVSAAIVPDSLDVLRMRAVVILFTVLPMFVAILAIWVHRYRHYHRRACAVFVVYWSAVVFLAPSPAILMGLLIPLMTAVIAALLLTFIVTWKTRRLQEIRSGVMAVGLVLIIASQALRVPLMELGLSYVAVFVNALATILAVGAFVIPRVRGPLTSRSMPDAHSSLS